MIYLLSAIGILLSAYMLYVSRQLETQGEKYKALCDLSDGVSCTKAAKDSHSQTFGISNGIWGIVFYTALMTSFFWQWELMFQVLIAIGFFGSVYLAYQLYVIRILCPVCILVHLLNFSLFIWIFFIAK